MCKFTGRDPMAQPPGSDTTAVPKRVSNGPSTKMEARMEEMATALQSIQQLLVAQAKPAAGAAAREKDRDKHLLA